MMGDAVFKRRLEECRCYEQMVCDFLRDNGIGCCSPETKENHTQLDIDVLLDDGRVIEVKSRKSTCVFTCPQDFPFPDIFVDTRQGWEEKKIKPFAYVFVSQDTGAMVWIPGDTRDQWVERKVMDRWLGYETWTLCADKGLIRPIGELVEILKEQPAEDEGT